MRTAAQRRARIARRKARKEWHKNNPKIRDYRLYVLKLENDKYYVGMTSYKDVRRRYEQHLDGTGAKWTKIYKPLKIMKVEELGLCTESNAVKAETILTIEYMEKYGIDNVRGGALCTVRNISPRKYNHYAKVKIVKNIETSKEIQYQEKLAKNLSWIV